MEINSNKPGIARTVSERRAISDAKKTGSAQSSSSHIPSELKEGQRVKGQVLDLRYNEVRIRLQPSGQTITAKLTGDVPLAIGDEANFEVSESSSGQIVLKYIPASGSASSMEQAALDAAVLKALTASGISLTERNKEITAELLLHRMPVDKQTLQTLIKAAVMNKEASPADLVLLHKNNIPLTSANIKLLQAYQSGSGQLLTDLKSLIQSIAKMFIPQGGQSNHMKASETAYTDNSAALPSDSPSVLHSYENQPQSLPDHITTPSSIKQMLQLNTELLRMLEDNQSDAGISMVAGNIKGELLSNPTNVIPAITSNDIIDNSYVLEDAGASSLLTGSDLMKKFLHRYRELPEGNPYEAEQLYKGVDRTTATPKHGTSILRTRL